jgi:hypothetical protein
MNVSTEQVRYYADFSREVQSMDTRTWGVQLVVARDEKLFIRRDKDATDRVEPQALGNNVIFPEPKQRFNAAGGGKKAGESLRDCALREMGAELGIASEGRMNIMEDLPILACGQIRDVDGQLKGTLLGVILIAYEPTEEEWEMLKEGGNMVEIDEALSQALKNSDLEMRPSFKMALQIGRLWNNGNLEAINQLVGGYNEMIVTAMREHCFQNDIELKQGIFGN